MKTFLLLTILCISSLLFSQSTQPLFNKAGKEREKFTTNSFPAQSDEFVGPFPSWTNVKTAYGAVGDGITDDAVAIQKGLDSIGLGNHSPVLYFPKGIYRITRTLNLSYDINVTLVGEDPDSTSFLWAGPIGGTMLVINGVAYSRFSRLTFNGNKKALIAVDQSWDDLKPYFDTGNEYSDDIFMDAGYGIRGGFLGYGFAETSVERSHFIRNTTAGISLGNFNALDLWVWYSTFDSCKEGVTNTQGAGNFHVYNSIFRGSTTADMSMGNTGDFSAIGNYSIGSYQFFGPSNGTNNPAPMIIQKNIILDPINSTPIAFGNQGPGLIMDNVIRSLAGASGPVIYWNSFIDADIESIGDTFTVANTISNNGRLIEIDDHVVNRSTINPVAPILPGTLPNYHRQIFEVPASAIADTIQKIINLAVIQNGNRPVVHFPYGNYYLNKTLIIPACDIQLVGDGEGDVLGTRVFWTGSDSTGPILRMDGPSKATLREIEFNGGNIVDCIVINNADQSGSRVYMDQAQIGSSGKYEVFVNGMDNTNVQLENFGDGSGNSIFYVTGGPNSLAGLATTSNVNIFSGAGSDGAINYEVSGGGKLLIRDVWYDSSPTPGFAYIHDQATFTLMGGNINPPFSLTQPAFDIANLNGKVALLATDISNTIVVSGDGSKANVLTMGIMDGLDSNYFFNISVPLANALLLNSRFRDTVVSDGSFSKANANIGTVDTALIRNTLSQARSAIPQPLNALPAGITDVRLFRVRVTNGINNITLNPSDSTTTSVSSYKDRSGTNVNIYPNPSNGKIFIVMADNSSQVKNIDVFNITGEIVLSQKNNCNNCNNFTIDLHSLNNGIYFVQIKNNLEEIINKKITIVKK